MEQIVNREQRAVQSVEVGGRLLIALGQHAAPMSLKDLAAAAELPASRAHPYLVSFGRLGLIEQDGTSGRYALGPAALQLGLACLHQLDPIKAAGPVAEALSQAIDQTVAIAVWANFGPTIVRVIEGSQPLHVNMRAGTVMSRVRQPERSTSWQVWKLRRSLDRQMRTSCSTPRRQATDIMSVRSPGFASTKARSRSMAVQFCSRLGFASAGGMMIFSRARRVSAK